MIAIALTIAAVCTVIALTLTIVHRGKTGRAVCLTIMSISLATAGIIALVNGGAFDKGTDANGVVRVGLQNTMSVDHWPVTGPRTNQDPDHLEDAVNHYLDDQTDSNASVDISFVSHQPLTRVQGTVRMPGGKHSYTCDFTAQVRTGKYNPTVTVQTFDC